MELESKTGTQNSLNLLIVQSWVWLCRPTSQDVASESGPSSPYLELPVEAEELADHYP